MWNQVLGIVWSCLAVAMLAGAGVVGLGWWLASKKPAPASEEIGTLKTKLKVLHEECDSCVETRNELEARVGDLEKALVSSKSRAAELEVRLRIMEAEKAERSAAVLQEPVEEVTEPFSEPASEPAESTTASTEAATWASLARSMENDELEEIHGIGPKLALLLHELGVHTFRQIALWNDSDIDRIEEKLPEFKGRVRREGWVQSAQECYWRKYHEAIGGYTSPDVEPG